jgi:flagellar biogenesis protein FliO
MTQNNRPLQQLIEDELIIQESFMAQNTQNLSSFGQPEISLSSQTSDPESLFFSEFPTDLNFQKSLSLIAFFGFMILITVNLKRFLKKTSYPNSSFKICDKQVLGPKTFLVKIESNHKALLLGFHEANFKVLSEWDMEDHPQLALEESQEDSLSSSRPQHTPPVSHLNEADAAQKASVDRLSELIRQKLKQVR